MSKRKVEPENVTGILTERTNSKGRRVKLTKKERQDLIRQQRAEGAAALFLDLDQALTWPQIAEKLDIPLGTVKVRIFRAREMLKSRLKDQLRSR